MTVEDADSTIKAAAWPITCSRAGHGNGERARAGPAGAEKLPNRDVVGPAMVRASWRLRALFLTGMVYAGAF
jgi:hypothetical protein